ncbi:IS110 family transposase [Nocardia vinacea]|uniref:IS110 family transposase n=1 Tax=Nocardia vinacea TaxID=96468 RepID=UPI002E14B334|nr:IS110 family transposase [Nocardia vinacea]
MIARLRWHLHELDPGWMPPGKLERASTYDRVTVHLAQFDGPVARLAVTLVEHCRRLTIEIDGLADEIGQRIHQVAASLLAIVGCADLTAAKIIGETAGVDRFRSKDSFARHNGSAPLPVWSPNRSRHRLSRTANRQLNAALHRIALTQARCDPDARALLAACIRRSSPRRHYAA